MENRMHVRRTAFQAAAAFVVLLAPAIAAAQSSTDSFERMTSTLRAGDRLVVTEHDGRKSTGRVVFATPGSLTLVVPDGAIEQRRVFDRAAVAVVRRTDSLWNGILIGAGIGFVGTEVWTHRACGRDPECAVYVRLAGWGAMGGGGAIVGAIIDKFTGNRVIYRAGTASAIRIAPVAGRRATGLAVLLQF
jgi:hypothetical protein